MLTSAAPPGAASWRRNAAPSPGQFSVRSPLLASLTWPPAGAVPLHRAAAAAAASAGAAAGIGASAAGSGGGAAPPRSYGTATGMLCWRAAVRPPLSVSNAARKKGPGKGGSGSGVWRGWEPDDADDGGEGGGGGGGGRDGGKGVYYGVSAGRQTGVFTSWEDVQQATVRFAGAMYRKFSTEREASRFVEQARAPPAGPFYAVARGHKVGVFPNWESTKEAVDGATGALFKRFKTQGEAEEFVAHWSSPAPGHPGGGAPTAAGLADIRSKALAATAGRARAAAKAAKRAAAAAAAAKGAAEPETVGGKAGAAEGLQVAARAAGKRGRPRKGAAASAAGTQALDGGDGAGARATAAAAGGGGEGGGAAAAPAAPIYFAVARGRKVGVFTSWEEASEAMEGVTDAVYRWVGAGPAACLLDPVSRCVFAAPSTAGRLWAPWL
ncbi:hypothetical protein TSOC_001455 [Tetrabaena socialis]|uniref:Ribonuclease H1 N-terminal domain-containing protein n=1 Tax=Tetrabaena socialis TaxID=47790 RepID=A0A2J8AGM5_9CHLO|nr:hypothetical protein TSOC_001455 [Tetrabaena socialis]|eukprot:PNH11670.1 hypothetical protein TSOC_001455 [Tetrabaena socialis]